MNIFQTIITTALILAVSASAKTEFFIPMCVCAGIYLLGCIASEISNLVEQQKLSTEQRNKEATELLRTLECIAMEISKKL
ncbi:MAG TPA: hypothetical protein VNX68_13985 [Nitrosopumilaceae archaeon]|jgi:hypothetical protein|nr:hypothetical protein [Nitrosopumilaceae archaeon]